MVKACGLECVERPPYSMKTPCVQYENAGCGSRGAQKAQASNPNHQSTINNGLTV